MTSHQPIGALPPRVAAALTMALCLLPAPELSAAPPPEDEPAPEAEPERPAPSLGTVHVELRTRNLSPKLTRKLTEQFDTVVQDRVLAVGMTLEPTPAADVIVQLEISRPQPEVPLHVVQGIAAIDGEVVVRGEVQSCMDCSTAELIDRGLEVLPDAAEAVLEVRRDAERAAEEQRAAAKRDALPPAAPHEFARERTLGPAGYVGISASVLGLGSAIAGAALLARGDEVEDTMGPTLTTRDYRPPGWALVGVGFTAMVAGQVLLAVDLAVLRRRKPKTARVTGVGASVAGAPGLLVEGQF